MSASNTHEQRKAYKLHRKSTRGFEPDTSKWSPFRAAEKKYKTKFPPPSLDHVLDLAALVASDDDLQAPQFLCRGSTTSVPTTEIRLHSASDVPRRAFTLIGQSGLVLLPSYLSPDEQRDLVEASLSEYAWLNETNLHAHYDIPPEGIWHLHQTGDRTLIHPKAQSISKDGQYASEDAGPRKLVNNDPGELTVHANDQMKLPPAPSSHLRPECASELLSKVRWANLGYLYHWGTKSYDFSKVTRPVPSLVRSLCQRVVREVEWEDVWKYDQVWGDDLEWRSWKSQFSPDAGIVNFYRLNSTLMGHVDRSELSSTSPLVSISLGRPAIFLIGGESRDFEPVPLLLRSGDVIIMSGPRCRRAYHGVPRILEDGPTPSYLVESENDTKRAAIANYIREARININVRQVFPHGMAPPMANNVPVAT